jgi:hypothetical protein
MKTKRYMFSLLYSRLTFNIIKEEPETGKKGDITGGLWHASGCGIFEVMI